MTNNKITMKDSLTNEVIINLDMLGTTMKNKVGSDVGSRYVITNHFDMFGYHNTR